ncbi:MAG: putative acetyltransferase [Frankiales bacterium]|nr:putative acetyltransferase [Frankiales bacterium]
MEFRSAAPTDVEAIVDLVQSAYRGESSKQGWTSEADLLDGQRTDPEAVREVLDDLVLAYEGEDLIGCCTLVPKDGFAYFGMFAVRPGLQGAGTGSRLLAEAERIAVDKGAAFVEMTVLSARRELIDFYLRRGYVDTGELRPFPYGDERFGKPRTDALAFSVLTKQLRP